MSAKPEIVLETGLQFFGQISASISHEIKNVMAIINENAGLLEDFTLMEKRGVPIDPERLKSMAEGVKKQIARADVILKNMNRFAHSIDHIFTEIDLTQTVELIIALTARFAAMRGIEVVLQLPEKEVKFQTSPYLMMNLLWLCLDYSMSACGDSKHIELVAEETKDDIRIQIKGLERLSDMASTTFPSDREKHLLEILAAELAIEIENKKIVLRLPRNLE
ncbi:FIG00602868: hypothetical protein [Olavius sp. associated proteobacterium Delta 1]|nr:FIG00602868: hypothetical protein [Olavius sp. associated proteobacterium Delta 1]